MDETSFWADYARRYGDDRDRLAKDGAGPDYEDPPRLLAVLKEPDNSPGADLRQDFLNGGAKWGIWRRRAEWVAEDIVPEDTDVNAHVLRLTDGTTLVRWRHPARCPGRESYDGLRDVIKSMLPGNGDSNGPRHWCD